MSMGFKKLRGLSLPEEKQGLIRYTCLTHLCQPRYVRDKIDRLCASCGGEHSAALRDVMCSLKSITMIALQYSVSESTLYRLRRKFYESW